MDVPEADAVEDVDSVFLHFIYGFLVLLGISILISLGKAIYHFYKLRRRHNVESVDDTVDTECHSVSNELSVLDRPPETIAPDSERLRLQLDKLRRLLNRLNAMGTFSRDTIGDLSAASAVRVNHSKAASSDMSEFWSSIDFDEFDDSTINDGNFGKTPTEKSVSPSISDFSLDTSGIPFDNVRRHKNFATSSRENVLNVSSAFNRRTNPSDAIIQILTILDSIMLKNTNFNHPLKHNNLKMDRKSDEDLNRQVLCEGLHPSESTISEQKLSLSPSASNNKNIYTHGSRSSDTVIIIPEDKNSETLNFTTKKVGSMLSSKPILHDLLSHTMDSQCKVPSAVSMEAKISKAMSIVNITSSSGSKKIYASKLSSSTKSLGDKISISQSVSLSIDPFTCLSTYPKEISKSLSAAPRDQICKDEQSKIQDSEISSSELGIDAIHRSHSLSDLLDKTLLSIESSIEKSYSYEKESEMLNLKQESKSQTLKSPSKSSGDSFLYKEILDNENAKSSSTRGINNQIFKSVSSRSLHSQLCLNSAILKSSVSEPEIKHSQTLGILSPNLSSSGSDTFLSPLVIDISPSEKIDWKSPMQLNSDTVVRDLTPHKENAVLSRKSFVWFTPPLPVPKEIVSDEIII